MPKLLAFVGGIHGAGKSFYVNSLSQRLSIPCVSAGQLIYKQNMTDKNVKNIDENQDALIRAFSQLSGQNYLMDGHYTLLNSIGAIERIDQNIFQQLNPEKLILVKTDPQIIMGRLAERDSKRYSIQLLTAMQEAEENYYLELCCLLGKDIDIVNGLDNFHNLL